MCICISACVCVCVFEKRIRSWRVVIIIQFNFVTVSRRLKRTILERFSFLAYQLFAVCTKATIEERKMISQERL